MKPEVLVGGYIEETVCETFEFEAAGGIGLMLASDPNSFEEYASF